MKDVLQQFIKGDEHTRFLRWAIVILNVVAWAWALLLFHDQPTLLGTSLLAYTFGLRHAVDADHIAAIDNATRKLMQEGKTASSAGFFFSLGHASVVILVCAGVVAASVAIQNYMGNMKAIGGIISTIASASFLLFLAVINFLIFLSVFKSFRAVRRGEEIIEEDLDLLLSRRGFFARIFRPLFALVSKSWHLFPIGFLFGIGFDTATEVALFGLSSTQAHGGLSFLSIMVMPALFTAGMLLIDTLDGMLMVGAYRWAFVRPIRKIYYNMTITLLSVMVAFFIGGIEVLALLSDKLSLQGSAWDVIQNLTAHFNLLGYIVIALFIGCWGISMMIYRLRNFDDIDVKFEQS
ncbi:HoxN/HupN/NixA family nickel/cobalt transporter [Sodalis sp. RH15]|uniref:HoxN/HupN/NixA family nickel/cobalt transporter n=1 Tax=Sodalis sp. RH15 TaxID=3394330 RepID=UPI0039B397A8